MCCRGGDSSCVVLYLSYLSGFGSSYINGVQLEDKLDLGLIRSTFHPMCNHFGSKIHNITLGRRIHMRSVNKFTNQKYRTYKPGKDDSFLGVNPHSLPCAWSLLRDMLGHSHCVDGLRWSSRCAQDTPRRRKLVILHSESLFGRSAIDSPYIRWYALVRQNIHSAKLAMIEDDADDRIPSYICMREYTRNLNRWIILF
jgi:hypothetical protein